MPLGEGSCLCPFTLSWVQKGDVCARLLLPALLLKPSHATWKPARWLKGFWVRCAIVEWWSLTLLLAACGWLYWKEAVWEEGCCVRGGLWACMKEGSQEDPEGCHTGGSERVWLIRCPSAAVAMVPPGLSTCILSLRTLWGANGRAGEPGIRPLNLPSHTLLPTPSAPPSLTPAAPCVSWVHLTHTPPPPCPPTAPPSCSPQGTAVGVSASSTAATSPSMPKEKVGWQAEGSSSHAPPASSAPASALVGLSVPAVRPRSELLPAVGRLGVGLTG